MWIPRSLCIMQNSTLIVLHCDLNAMHLSLSPYNSLGCLLKICTITYLEGKGFQPTVILNSLVFSWIYSVLLCSVGTGRRSLWLNSLLSPKTPFLWSPTRSAAPAPYSRDPQQHSQGPWSRATSPATTANAPLSPAAVCTWQGHGEGTESKGLAEGFLKHAFPADADTAAIYGWLIITRTTK